jgi:hypothetical protein
MNMKPIFLLAIVSVTFGCAGSFEFRKRPDNSEAAVLKRIDDAWPVIARDVVVNLEANAKIKGQVTDAAAKFGLENKVHQLYEEMDQINAHTRTLVVANYVAYINVELEPDPATRERGRQEWKKTQELLTESSLRLREINHELKGLIKNKDRVDAKQAAKFLTASFEKAQYVLADLQSATLESSWEYSAAFEVNGNQVTGRKLKWTVGVIESVDPLAGKVVVKSAKQKTTFSITEYTKLVTGEKRAATLSDFKIGDDVSVAYLPDNTAIRIKTKK